MDKLKFICLILIVFIGSSNALSQTINLYIDIAPSWNEKSLEYWSDTKAYGKKTPSQVKEEILKNNKLLRDEFFLSLRESFYKQSIDLVLVQNPTELYLQDGALYAELISKVNEAGGRFPYYYKNNMTGVANVDFELRVYDGDGRVEYSKTLTINKELKLDVYKSLSAKTKYYQDVEGFKILLEKSQLSVTPNIVDVFLTNDFKTTDVSNQKFNNELISIYQRKKIEYPRHYSSLKISSAQRPAVIITTSANKYVGESIENAAFGDTTMANNIGAIMRKVKYYALIIGINDYQDPKINDLDNPINDARLLRQTLTTYYTFDNENLILLENPTRSEIINTLDNLSATVDEQSNLLIFYAGHGLWDAQLKKGYWLPSDGAQTSRANWLSNSDLVDYVGGIRSKHTLLITDACFSGSIFKTRSVFTGVTKAVLEMYKYPSKKAMTSGAMKTVPDKSVFIEYLVKRLAQNNKPFLPAEELFASFKHAVVNNSPSNQIPLFGEIQGAGDEGGDFIFILK